MIDRLDSHIVVPPYRSDKMTALQPSGIARRM
jgi:hypothetical protein